MANVTGGRGGSDFVEGRHCRQLVGDHVPEPDGGSVVRVPMGDRCGWLVTGYERTREFLRDQRFSRATAAAANHPRGPATLMSITELDPPQHTRLRNLIGGAFSARRSERLRPYVERFATDLIRRLIEQGPTADLLAEYCVPLTFAAQAELLGVPRSRRDVLRKRAIGRLGRPGSTRTEVYQGELLLHDEVATMLADRDDPPAGLLAELVTAARVAGLLTETELTGLASSLFFDGYALAAAQIANTVLCLISRPGLLGRLHREPELVGAAVEESLRYSPSVNFSMTRTATGDVDIDGVRIRANDLVTAALPMANRDERAFTDPHRFSVDRAGSRHLSFGHGTHHCLGAHLARVEIQVALRVLAAHAPGLSLAIEERDLEWTVSPTMRTLSALPVRWRTLGGTQRVPGQISA